MMKRATTILTACLTACLTLFVALPVQAQDEVTVRQIHDLPQASIDELNALGLDMTAEQFEELIQSPFSGQTVTFQAVVLAEPIYSGRASVDDDDGLPGRVHFFVRDTSAAAEGSLGMDIQIVDGNYTENQLLTLFRGDVIEVTGEVSYFGPSLQIAPESVEFLGGYESLGLPASLLEPTSVTTTDLHMNMGGTIQQVDWDLFEQYNHQYVRIEGATVWRSPNRTDARPNWAVTSDGAQTILLNIDTSLCYRNDKNDYPDTFYQDCIDNDFEAPPPGAIVDVEGFSMLDGNFDPFSIGDPAGAYYKIATWEEDDLVITQQPSITSVEFEAQSTVYGNEVIDVTVNVDGDLSGVESATLTYETSAMTDEATIALTDQGGGTYTAGIPAQTDGTFVSYSAAITHENGTDFTTPSAATTRVLYDGIDAIEDIQTTWSGIGDESPFAGQTLSMDITATVQTDPATSGLIVVQDDAELSGFSGVMISDTEELLANLTEGDVINITEATVVENFDVTELSDITYTVESEGNATHDYKVVDTSVLQDDEIAEAHEGMMLRFEDAIILEPDAGFGEWSFSSDGSEENQVFADDASADLGSSFNDRFSMWERIDFMQGVWWYSFGAYKLVPETAADVGVVTNVAVEDESVPGSFVLEQNYPNPFNPSTSISFTIPTSGHVMLEVFDMLGRSVDMLVNEERGPGTYEVTLDGTDLSSGVYIYRLTAGDKTSTRKMMLMK